MSDYAATALSLTSINRHWRDVASTVFAYLKREHEPFPAPPPSASLLVVDSESRRIVKAPTTELLERLEPESGGVEHWRAFSAEVWFGGSSSFIHIRVREVHSDQTQLEIWFPSRTYETIFNFDPDCREFSSEAKSDLVRLMIGIARACDCIGFVYRPCRWGNVAWSTVRKAIKGVHRN